MPEHQIRVIAPDVGGAFGAKGGLYPGYALVAALAWKLCRPLKWVETRSESFLATNHGRDQRQRVRAAFRRDGTLLGPDVEILSNLGAWNASPTRPTAVLTGLAIAGPYRVPALRLQVRCVVTNTTPQAAYRGAGRPEASYLLERLMDKAARELGLDPVTIREQNLLRPDDFPYRSPTGVPYDSGNYPAVLTEALRRFDYETARREQARLRAQGRMIGIGIASFCELSGPGWESATVRAHPDGTVTVLCGITPSGQGHATMLAQVVGEVLQLPLERIRVVTGDTVAVQQGIGTFGSRSTALGGSAAFLAAQEVLEKARAIAASALEVAPEDLEYRDGLFAVRGAPDRTLPWGTCDTSGLCDGGSTWEPRARTGSYAFLQSRTPKCSFRRPHRNGRSRPRYWEHYDPALSRGRRQRPHCESSPRRRSNSRQCRPGYWASTL